MMTTMTLHFTNDYDDEMHLIIEPFCDYYIMQPNERIKIVFTSTTQEDISENFSIKSSLKTLIVWILGGSVRYEVFKDDILLHSVEQIPSSINKITSFIELLRQIKKRPSLFLIRNYISCLKSFLDGWYHGREYNVPDADIFGEFQDWIVNKYQITTSHGWCSIILFYHIDERRALTAFFELFDEFLIEKQMEVL